MKYIFDFDIRNNKQVLTIDIFQQDYHLMQKVHSIFNVSDLLNNMRFTIKEQQNAKYNLEKFLQYLYYENRNT